MTEDRLRTAFSLAALTLNPAQAQALAALMETGRLTGTTLPDVDPPRSVALAPVGEREGLPVFNEPATHTLLVWDEDGRAWQIVRAGITWPFGATTTEGGANGAR
jgi:hypothetical protein